jgi:hypothetical protein
MWGWLWFSVAAILESSSTNLSSIANEAPPQTNESWEALN